MTNQRVIEERLHIIARPDPKGPRAVLRDFYKRQFATCLDCNARSDDLDLIQIVKWWEAHRC